MYEIIHLNNLNSIYVNNEKYQIYNINNTKYFNEDNFKRTLTTNDAFTNICCNKTNIFEHTCWTNKNMFTIETPIDATTFFRSKNIVPNNNYTLLKYDFSDFLKNCDEKNSQQNYKYVCLIYFPYNKFVGGNLILDDIENSVQIKFNPCNYLNPVMIIFSIDMQYEILPIIKGPCYIYKTLLCVNDEQI